MNAIFKKGLIIMSLSVTGMTQAEPLSLSVEGGVYRMFTRGEDRPVLVLEGPVGAELRLVARDASGQLAGWEKEVELTDDGARIEFPDKIGYHRVEARGTADGRELAATVDLGIVPPQAPGARPESFFGSNTSSVRTGDQLRLLNTIGMRVQRSHFQGWARAEGPTDGSALPMRFDGLDKQWNEARESGSWVLPITAYAFENAKSELAGRTNMHGPPRDFEEFCATWRVIIERYPEIETYEFWNEPWIFGWTWAADAVEYRRLQTMFLQMALEVNPDLRLLAGSSSMFVEDHIEPYPESWKGLLQGTTHHPYVAVTHPTMRGGAQARSIDHGMVVTRRMGLPYYYLTEGGTRYRDPEAPGSQHNNIQNARKLIHYHLRAALSGAYRADIQWNIGYGPEWTLPNTAYAFMASQLEDRPVVAEIWPRHELIWGAVFANPRHVDEAVRALPRADELRGRWEVPVPEERTHDPTKVAVLYSLTGASNEQIDTGGTLTIEPAGDLRAFDLTGREIMPEADRLVLPFTESPVYVTTEELPVAAFRNLLANARISGVTPVNAYAASLTEPANREQTLLVRVQNQLNRELSGRIEVETLEGVLIGTAPFTAPAGKLVDVGVPWQGMPVSDDNQYGVTVNVKTEAGEVRRQQILAHARFARRTITVDGNLDDWEGLPPVLLDSDRLKGGVDLTRYLLNPHLERPTGDEKGERVLARLWTAYDDENVYLAMAVKQDSFSNRAGQSAKRGDVELPYRTGMPEGLDHIRYTGDSLMVAFGFRDRVPGWGRQMDDLWVWKGHFHDTDYQYVAHSSVDGPQLIRLWGADTPRRTAYQTTAEPWVIPVEGSEIVISRDEERNRTVYEFSIPRRELDLFDPAEGHLRFSFQLVTDQPVNGSNVLRWSEAAGVFDHWWNGGSFSPSWEENLPCQTFFGIEP